MDHKKDIKEELEEISPFLAGLEKERNFKVPVNYFAQMQEELWEKVRPEAPQETVVAPKRSWLDQMDEWLAAWFQPRMALGFASLLLLLTAGWFVLQNNDQTVNPVASAEAPALDDEASEYLALHLDEFDADLILQLDLDEEELSEVVTSDFSEEEDGLDAVLDELLNELDTDDLEQLL